MLDKLYFYLHIILLPAYHVKRCRNHRYIQALYKLIKFKLNMGYTVQALLSEKSLFYLE